jgi:hypothetical protein
VTTSDPIADIIGDYRAFAAMEARPSYCQRHRHRSLPAQPPEPESVPADHSCEPILLPQDFNGDTTDRCGRIPAGYGLAAADMGDHDGAADLRLDPDGRLAGRYFNSRPRAGTIEGTRRG